MRYHTLFVAALVVTVMVGVHAQTLTVGVNAVNNATVRPDGPRTGLNGKRFFNIEGNSFGTFASFGVVDFDAAEFGLSGPVVDVVGIRLKLYDAPAAFSTDGTVRFWLSEDTTTDIEPGASPLHWDATALPDGLGIQLRPVYLLGSGVYTKTALDTEFVYALSVPDAARSYLLAQVNSGGRIRVVVTPAEDGVAATYAGYNHSQTTTPPARPPRLELTIVPQSVRYSIEGNVALGEFGGDITQVGIFVQLRQGGAVVRETTLFTDANGNYTIPNVEPGAYDVAFKASHWLRVVVPSVTVTNADVTGVNVTLTNGDVDGDNEVTLFDFGAIVAAFGALPGDANWNAEADLDGDEEVTLFDFGIVVRNFGAIGDD